MATNKIFVDGIASFERGINSGIAPILLDRNQISFATNATVRGAFIKPRPSYRKMELSFESAATQTAFEDGLFQGAARYKADSGSELLFAAVSGRLFEFGIGETSATVSERTVEDGANSTTATINWMWQAEKWLIWNDGVNLPVFITDTTAYRSNHTGYSWTIKNLTDTSVSTASGTVAFYYSSIGNGSATAFTFAAGSTTDDYKILRVYVDYDPTIIPTTTYLTINGVLYRFIITLTFNFFESIYAEGRLYPAALVESDISVGNGSTVKFATYLSTTNSDPYVTPAIGLNDVLSVNDLVNPDVALVVYLGSESKSHEIVSVSNISIGELPAGRMGCYGMGRNWMSLTDGRSFVASDIVGDASGTLSYNYRDAVLNVSQPLLAAGRYFVIPESGNTITAMIFTAMLDTSLGQGPLQVFTQNLAFSCDAPISETEWDATTNPILTQSLITGGNASHHATVQANSDTLFRGSDKTIRSLILAKREFATWGNTPISREVSRIIEQDDVTLLEYTSGSVFSNRYLLTSNPTQGDGGVFNRGFIALNFDPISSMGSKNPSVYDGLWIGLNTLRVMSGKFSGEDRCFVFGYNQTQSKIELYEILDDDEATTDFDGTTNKRITWNFETACLFKDVDGKSGFDSVKLEDGEMRLADIQGVVDYIVYYRPQFHPCWTEWASGSVSGTGQPQNKVAIGLGKPTSSVCDPTNNRQMNIAEMFQFKFVFTGSCKFYGAKFKASLFPELEFAKVNCATPVNVDESCTNLDDYDLYTLEDV